MRGILRCGVMTLGHMAIASISISSMELAHHRVSSMKMQRLAAGLIAIYQTGRQLKPA
jgi:type IV secretory pathway ATPase VirB11/archaellum biosynthesis ATPase